MTQIMIDFSADYSKKKVNKKQKIHANSRKVNLECAKHFGERFLLIMNTFIRYNCELSDRQVCKQLGFSDMNAVRPRITELTTLGFLEEIGKTIENGRTVRVSKITENGLQAYSSENF